MTKEAAIFDFDGTLVDSIDFHFDIHRNVFSEVGINLTRVYFFKECNGMEPYEFYQKIIHDSKKEPGLIDLVWKAMLREKKRRGLTSIRLYPGVKQMLNTLKKKGIRMIIASSSHEGYVNSILRNNSIREFFDGVVGSDGIKKSKPDPSIFIKAWKSSGMEKDKCIIVEDSINGVNAARRAGIDAICLTTTTNIENIPEYALIAERHSDVPNLILGR